MSKRLKYIFHFVMPHWWKFIILFLSIIGTTFIGSSFNYLFGRMVDEVFYSKNMSAFVGFVIIYGIIFLVNQIMHFVLNMTWANLKTQFLYDIRYALFQKVMKAKGMYLSGIYSGDMVSRMDKDVDEFMNFIHWNIFYSFSGVLSLLISIGYIAYINLWLAILVVVITPVSVYFTRYYSKKVKSLYQNIRKQEGKLDSWLFEILKGMKEIRMLSASKHILGIFTNIIIKITRQKISATKIEVLSERLNAGLSLLGQLILYSVSAILVWKGKLTIGGFVSCVSYYASCITIFNNLNNRVTAISGNIVSIDRVIETLENEEENYNNQTLPIEINFGEIVYKQVSFCYDIQYPVLRNFSIRIKSGERIALIGRSGAGKSTITSLLLKLYEPNEGKIMIDGTDINDYNLISLREQIGIVNQETVLFDGSVRYNLTYNNNLYEDEQIYHALEKAHLLEFIKSLPMGLDTILGHHGQLLSGGQKQRLAIARIFLRNPKILIFDEATSSLDSEAESVIKESWGSLCRMRTMIIIAHRLSTILSTDKVAVLQNGTLVGYDKHETLLKSCSEYKQLFKEQYANGMEMIRDEI